MSKFRKIILILGILIVFVAASLGTALALYATGSIKTDPIKLVYEVEAEEKIYDGKPLKAERASLTSGKLINGHYAELEYLGEQTEVGTSLSDLSVKIYDIDGHNVTGDYSIKVIGAALSVYKKPLKVKMPAQKVVYNGSKVLFEKYEVLEEENKNYGGLVSGHKIYGSAEAMLLNVGDTLPESLKPLVYDKAGNDVTKNYDIDFKIDPIEVIPRKVTVRPQSLKKTYDGAALVCSQIEYVDGTLADGQYAKWEINGGNNYVRDVNSDGEPAEMRLTSFTVYQNVGGVEVEVTENYEIDYETGTLEVTKRPLTITAKSGEWVYNGEERSMRGDEEPLKVEGLADSDSVIAVAYSGTRTNAGTSANIISEVTLSCSTDNYDIRRVNGTLTITPYAVEIKTKSDEKYYDGTPLSGAIESVSLANGKHMITVAADSEQPKITDAGSIINEYECEIFDENENDVTSNYKITYKYGTLTVNKMPVTVTLSDKEVKVYDGTSQSPDWSNSDYFDMKAVDDEHTLSLTYEDFNIVSFNKTMTDVGEYSYSVQFKEYELSKNYSLLVTNYGYLTISPRVVGVQSGGGEKEYDGTPLYSEQFTVRNGTLAAGHRYETSDFTQITEVGEDENVPTITVYDADNKDVTKNYKFEFTQKGKLIVKKCKLTVELNAMVADKAFIYTGEPVQPLPADVIKSINKKQIIDESAFKVVIEGGEAKNVGKYSYSVEIADEAFANNFDMAAVSSTLDINRLAVTVTLKDYVFTYGGKEITVYASDAVSTDTNILSGRDFKLSYDKTVNADGTTEAAVVKDAGTYYYTAELIDEKIAGNFDFTFVTGVMPDEEGKEVRGTVKVNPLEVTVKLKDYTQTYNSKECAPAAEKLIREIAAADLEADDFEIEYGDGGEEHINAGTYAFGVRLSDAKVAKNYVVKYTPATLVIKPAKVMITYQAATKTYNGNAITVTAAEALKNTLGYDADVMADLSGKLALTDFETVFDNEVKNAGKYKLKVQMTDEAKAANYKVVETNTEYLTVNKANLTVTAKAHTAEYNGKVQTSFPAPTITTNYDSLTADSFVIDCGEEIKNAGTYTYKLAFADEALASNYNLTAASAQYEITAVDVVVKLKNYTFTYGEKYSIDASQAILGVEGSDLIAKRYLNLDLGAVQKTVGDYAYTVKHVDPDMENNFTFSVNTADVDNQGKITIEKRKIQFRMNDLTVTQREYDEYEGWFEMTYAVYLSSSTPLAEGDTLVFTSVTAEDIEGMLVVVDCVYTLTNEENYEIVDYDEANSVYTFTSRITVIG